jgi:hypothetical protein
MLFTDLPSADSKKPMAVFSKPGFDGHHRQASGMAAGTAQAGRP